TASLRDMPSSPRCRKVWAIVLGIVSPPGEPSTRASLDPRRARVGAIELVVRRPGLGVLTPTDEKEATELLSTMPVSRLKIREPKLPESVTVQLTSPPSASTTLRWVVCCRSLR